MKVVIFCGGHGTRFWPVSRKSMPKQFVPFLDGKSFFEITYNRFRKIFSPEEIFISTDLEYIHLVKKQAPDVPHKNIIGEPEKKDLLAACGLATVIANKYFPGEPLLMSWSKHLIARESIFLKAVKAAGAYANKTGLIVSVDSKPSYPSIYNGWVKLGKKIAHEEGFNILEIEKHVEKPKKEIADKLFKSKKWIINTGYRVWKSDVMLDNYKKFHPDMYAGLLKIAEAWGTKRQNSVLSRTYSSFISESIEYGIFEKMNGGKRATIAADMGWEDVGMSWDLFYRSLVTPNKQSIIEGGAKVEFIDSEKNLIIGPKGKMIAVVGLSNIAIIDTPDGLLVSALDESQKVKDIYKKIDTYYKEFTE